MKGIILAGALLLAVPAQAASVFVFGSSTFTIGSGDSFDDVVVIDTAHLDFQGGTVTGNVFLLEDSTATLSGGTINGQLEVFNNGAAAIVVQPGSALLDGSVIADGTVITEADCLTCAVDGTFTDASTFTVVSNVLQGGSVQIQPIATPEPTTLALAGFGLLGLALLGHSRC